MKDLSKAYEELINPIYIRSLFKTDLEFEYWCLYQPIEDLQNFLKVFEEIEDYENCIIIRDCINEVKLLQIKNRYQLR
jgi:hypothetical protein